MPLVRAVDFKAVVQKGNRFQVPKLVRWEFKMESSQVLMVTVKPVDSFGLREQFFGRMNADGRITIPKITIAVLQEENKGESLVGCVISVRLEPSSRVSPEENRERSH